MQKKELGCILKPIHFSQKVSILTLFQGKITLVVKNPSVFQQMRSGTVISFNPIKQSSLFIGEDIEILYSLNYRNLSDMHWNHHLLELCYYFMPIESPSSRIFYWLLNSYSITQQETFSIPTQIIQKIYILYFLYIMGFFPKGVISQYIPAFSSLKKFTLKESLLTESDFPKDYFNQLTNENMDILIIKTLEQHPYFKCFKTIRFVY